MALTFSWKVASVQRGAAIAAGLLGHSIDMALPIADGALGVHAGCAFRPSTRAITLLNPLFDRHGRAVAAPVNGVSGSK